MDAYRDISGEKVDFKNVQRRVYDSLNVLSAMNIIKKDKNFIVYDKNNVYIRKERKKRAFSGDCSLKEALDTQKEKNKSK